MNNGKNASHSELGGVYITLKGSLKTGTQVWFRTWQISVARFGNAVNDVCHRNLAVQHILWKRRKKEQTLEGFSYKDFKYKQHYARILLPVALKYSKHSLITLSDICLSKILGVLWLYISWQFHFFIKLTSPNFLQQL